MILTVNEFAAKTGTTYAVASNALKFMVDKGVVKKAGIRPPQSGGKGKPSTLFDVPEGPCAINLLD